MVSKTKKAVSNYFYIVMKEAAIVIIGIYSRALFIKKIGIEYVGLTGLLHSVLGILCLSNLGVGDGLKYVMIQAIARNDKKKVMALYDVSKKIYVYISAALVIFAFLLAPILPHIFKSGENIEHLYFYYMIYVIDVILSYAIGPYSIVYGADQNLKKLNLGEMLGYTITSLLQIASLLIWSNFNIYILLMLFKNAFQFVFIRHAFKKDYRELDNGTKETLSSDDRKVLLNRVKDVFLTRMVSTASESTDSILLNKLSGMSAMGMYNNYLTIFSDIRIFSKSAYYSIESGIGHINTISGKKTIYTYYKRELFAFHGIASVLSICALALAQEFIGIWVGKENILPLGLVIIMSLDFYLNTTMYALSCCVNTTDLFKDMKRIFAIGVILNIALSIILGIRFGLIGIVGATFISRIICIMPMLIRLVYQNLFEMSMMKGILLNGYYLVQYLLLSAAVAIAASAFHVDNYFMWVIKGCVIFIGTILLWLLVNRKNSSMFYFKDRIKQVLRNM